jgi:hypothetical protein
MSLLNKKLNYDVDIIGPGRYEIDEDISKMTHTIVEQEQEINNSMNYLQMKQLSLSEFLVDYNKNLEKRESKIKKYIENNESLGN